MGHRATVGAFAVALILGCSAIAHAAEFAGGTGEPNDPYQIATPGQLITLGSDPNLWNKHFALVRDLDMTGVDPNAMNPIGNYMGEPFIGVFDGRGHVIGNLRILRDREVWVGLFGKIGEGTEHPADPNSGHVRDLHLKDVRISGVNVVGGLAGELASGTIRNCSVTGAIAGKKGVGGLVGWTHGEIAACRTTVDVQGETEVGGLVGDMSAPVTHCRTSGHVQGQGRVGGLIGTWGCAVFLGGTWESPSAETVNAEKILQCASDCSVTGEKEVGGLVACVVGVGVVEDCYARGSVTGSTEVGGLVGHVVGCCIVRCFSAGSVKGEDQTGAFIGRNEPTEGAELLTQYPPCQFIVKEIKSTSEEHTASTWLHIYRPAVLSCFWDAEASRMTRSLGSGADEWGGVNSLTTAQMRTAEAFRNFGWDFDAVWMICEGKDYPRLRWEGVRCDE